MLIPFISRKWYFNWAELHFLRRFYLINFDGTVAQHECCKSRLTAFIERWMEKLELIWLYNERNYKRKFIDSLVLIDGCGNKSPAHHFWSVERIPFPPINSIHCGSNFYYWSCLRPQITSFTNIISLNWTIKMKNHLVFAHQSDCHSMTNAQRFNNDLTEKQRESERMVMSGWKTRCYEFGSHQRKIRFT